MPILLTPRRDPPKTEKGISLSIGFTVIELLVAVAVTAVIMALALPSYRSVLEKRQVTSTAEQLSAFLSSAKVLAVEHNQFVAVKYQSTGGSWCFGMRADDTPAATCDCAETDVTAANACAVDNALRVLQASDLNYPQVLSNATIGDDGTLVFDPIRGLTRDAEVATLELLSDDSRYALNVEISVTGRVKICSNKDADKDVPGFDECSI